MQSEKIIGVRKLGNHPTMDIEVNNKHHLFYANNIAVSNSHSVEYGITSYITAYWKCKYPLDTFVARLQLAESAIAPQEEVERIVRECLSEDIDVKLPNINQYFVKFDTVDDQYIIFGWADIKGVGESHVEKVKDAIDKVGAQKTWFDWLFHFGHKIPKEDKIPLSVFKSFIEVGMFDDYGISRRQMVFDLENFQHLSPGEQKWMRANWKGETLVELLKLGCRTKKEGGAAQGEERVKVIQSIITQLENPPYEMRDTIDYILNRERDLLGVSLTYSKIDKFDTSLANATLKQFSEGNGIPNPAMFACEIVQVRRTNIKKQGKNFGREMALLTLRDETMTFNECVIFPDDWDKYGEHFHEGAVLVIEAEADRFGKSLIIKRAARMERSI